MTKSQKLHETRALFVQCQQPLFMGTSFKYLNNKQKKRITPLIKDLVAAFDAIEKEILLMINENREHGI